jgi:ADP-ribosylation factor-like protein 1
MSVIQSLLQRFWPQKKSRNIFVGGLDYSGKTAIVYKLLLDETVTTIPTIGFNIETVSVPTSTKHALASQVNKKSHSAMLWDIGGCGQVNPIRRLYLSSSEHTDAVIWVVDAADHSRKQEAVDELKTFLQELGEFVRDKPFLV